MVDESGGPQEAKELEWQSVSKGVWKLVFPSIEAFDAAVHDFEEKRKAHSPDFPIHGDLDFDPIHYTITFREHVISEERDKHWQSVISSNASTSAVPSDTQMPPNPVSGEMVKDGKTGVKWEDLHGRDTHDVDGKPLPYHFH